MIPPKSSAPTPRPPGDKINNDRSLKFHWKTSFFFYNKDLYIQGTWHCCMFFSVCNFILLCGEMLYLVKGLPFTPTRALLRGSARVKLFKRRDLPIQPQKCIGKYVTSHAKTFLTVSVRTA